MGTTLRLHHPQGLELHLVAEMTMIGCLRGTILTTVADPSLLRIVTLTIIDLLNPPQDSGGVLKVLPVSPMITLLMGMAAVLALIQMLALLLLPPSVGILVTIFHAMAVTPQSQLAATDDLEYLARSKSKPSLRPFGRFSIHRLALPTNSGLLPNSWSVLILSPHFSTFIGVLVVFFSRPI